MSGWLDETKAAVSGAASAAIDELVAVTDDSKRAWVDYRDRPTVTIYRIDGGALHTVQGTEPQVVEGELLDSDGLYEAFPIARDWAWECRTEHNFGPQGEPHAVVQWVFHMGEDQSLMIEYEAADGGTGAPFARELASEIIAVQTRSAALA
jgi:hypothetical protein